MSGFRWVPLLLTALSLASSPDRVPARADEPFARVLKVRGPASLRTRLGEAWTRLTMRDEGRVLLVGWTVKCAPGGYLLLQLGAGADRKPLDARKSRSPLSYTIPRLAGTPPVSPILQEIRLAFVRAGRSRPAGAGGIYSPAPESAVTPRRVVLRWLPRRPDQILSLSIADPDGKVLWHHDGVPGPAGQFGEPSLGQALEEHRSQGGRGPLALTVSDLDGSTASLTFSLLSAPEEELLERELARGEGGTASPLERHTRRALVFTNHRMLADAAQELDAALVVRPPRRDLLVAAVLAHRVTGNTVRENELRQRLPPGTAVPE